MHKPLKSDEKEPPRVEVDATGKVRDPVLPEAGKIRDTDVDDAIDALDESIGNREKDQERFREKGQNTSADPAERQKYRAHQDRINQEKKLRDELKRRKKQLEDRGKPR